MSATQHDLFFALREGNQYAGVTLAESKRPYGVAVEGRASVVHRVAKVAILWGNGQPRALGARWLCHGSTTAATLLHAPPEGMRPCRPCGLVETDAGSVVYFAERDGLIKIGVSRQPVRRIAALKATLVASMPGTRYDEAAAHERFAGSRVVGEWFSPSSDLLSYIDGLLDGAQDDLACECERQPAHLRGAHA